MAQKIMIIRHAEKPGGENAGISADGTENAEDLTVRGWQRSGALVRFFAPADGVPIDNRLAMPQSIFAAGVGSHSKSLRPQHTVATLAAHLGLVLNTGHLKGQESTLVGEILTKDAPVLVAWQHEAIPGIVNEITGNATTCPQQWPDERFDLVWVLDRPSPAEGWSFNQVPQMLLPGDDNTEIADS